MRSCPAVAWAAALALLLPAARAQSPDVDTDGDGLSDFHEIHKHRTDPRNPDSDGDGIPDGDPQERREFTYTVRAVLQVMAPFDVASMTDDWQDARVLRLEPDLLEVEVVIYPFGTAGEGIGSDPGWRRRTAGMKAWIAPGVTTNWDAALRRDLVAELRQQGVDAERSADRELVQAASRWLMQRSRFEDSFTTFAVEFVDGRPRVVPAQQDGVADTLRRHGRTLQEQWDRELFGAGMFRTRTHGSCTSTAIYLATGLKALGLPTRTVVCVPVVDAGDRAELALVRERITNHRVRGTILAALQHAANAWTSHTCNEVFVDGRWRRLNYDRLGQGVLDRDCLGLMVHVHTFADHAEAGLHGWGLRRQHRRHAQFGGHNPYSCVELDDAFGPHGPQDNPAVGDDVPRQLTIARLYWFDDPGKHPMVAMRLDEPAAAGHLIAHVEEAIDFEACRAFYGEVHKQFVLTAAGQPDVPLHATRGFWCKPDAELREFYLRIEPEHWARMAPGVAYRLRVAGEPGEWRFRVGEGVGIARPDR